MSSDTGQLERMPESLLYPPDGPGRPDGCQSLDNLAVLWARFRQSGQLPDLDRVVEHSEEALVQCPPAHPGRAEPLNNLALALLDRFQQLGQLVDLNRAIKYGEEALALRPSGAPHRSQSLNCLAIALRRRFGQSGQAIDLDRAVEHHEEALVLRPAPHSDRDESLNNLALALLDRFRQSGQLVDLNKAIEHSEEALMLRPSGHPHRSKSLNGLALALRTRFWHSRQVVDSDRAIEHYGEALVLRPSPNSDRAESLNNLAQVLWDRSQSEFNASDLNKAVKYNEDALVLRPPPHPDRSQSLNNLSITLGVRFQRSGELIDLNRAIEHGEEALVLRLPPHPDRSQSLNNLASRLSTRFERLGQLIDLDKAIEQYEEQLVLTLPPHPYRSMSLYNLAGALCTRFDQLRQLNDLNRAIGYIEESLALRPPGHPDRPWSLNNLANALWARFEQGGQLIDLDRAVKHQEEALVLHPPGHPNRASCLNHLAVALQTRFVQSAKLVDLDKAIEHSDQALVLCPPGHHIRCQSLNNLSSALWTRFKQTGVPPDLDNAISSCSEALQCTPDSLRVGGHVRLSDIHRSGNHPNVHLSPAEYSRGAQFEFGIPSDRFSAAMRWIECSTLFDSDPTLCSDGSAAYAIAIDLLPQLFWLELDSSSRLQALRARFEGGQLIDSDRAVKHQEEALVLHPPDHPKRASCLNHLAVALRTRFVQSAKLVDLDKAIEHSEQALILCPPGHHLRCQSLNNLSSALWTRFKQTGVPPDLDNAISSCSEALQCTPDSLRVGGHVRLSDIHRSGNHPNVHLSPAEYSRGAQFEFGIPSDRFSAAMRWIECSALFDPTPYSDGSAAYAVAIDLLPQLFWLELDSSSRLQALRRASMLGCDAAAWAIRSGDFSRAVELLEQGRAIFWAYSLHIQNPFDELPDDLGARLRKLSRQLQATVSSERSTAMSASETYRQRKLQTDWIDTIKYVRGLPGFEHFLRTPPFSQLAKAAKNGPVVIVIASVHGCSALVLKQGCETPHNIPFDISYDDVQNLRDRLTRVLKSLGVGRFRNGSSGHMAQTDDLTNEEKEISRILVALWDEVVELVIDHLELTRSPNPPRLWWCPTGPFAFLPLHAATKGNRTTAQFVVSSYTPTLEALMVAQSSPTIVKDPTIVVVTQPEVKGLPVLEQTMEEFRRIAAAVPSEFMLNVDGTRNNNQEPESPEAGTVQNVLDRLEEASIVHLACHGKQDLMMPLESALFLHDGKLTISKMQSIHRALPASLAFLSACHSARGDDNQPDEAIHLAAAMLSVGFQSTVGTMWPMADHDGPVIAETFYKELFKDRALDSSRSAYALHEAVKQLRNMKVSASRWVPFIHVGR